MFLQRLQRSSDSSDGMTTYFMLRNYEIGSELGVLALILVSEATNRSPSP
jgi:hypothetical protein